MPPPFWECDGCDYTTRCDPLSLDDWGGEEVACGPSCPRCDLDMELVEEDAMSLARRAIEEGRIGEAEDALDALERREAKL